MFAIAQVQCACGSYPAIPGWYCQKGHRPVSLGPIEFYTPTTAVAVERGSTVQLVLKVRGLEAAA